MRRILSIGPATTRLAQRNRALVNHGYVVRAATSRREALDSVRTGQFDLALICEGFPDGYARDLAGELAGLDQRLRMIILPEGTETIDDILDLLAHESYRSEAA